MTDDLTWRLFRIDGAINEPEPQSQDPQAWAEWLERKASAGSLLREEALAVGDVDGAETAADLAEKAMYAARRLRGGDAR